MSLDDAAARALALDPEVSFLVEAAAGSGKTSLLTQRFLVLLTRVEEPERILAVTFTRKAAEEMRGRVLEALALATGPVPEDAHGRTFHALGGAVLARDAARGWNLRAHPTRLRIQTIDALAAALARGLPLTAGFAARLEVVDDAEDLYRAAARATLECLADEEYGDTVARVLEHLENDARRLENLLIERLARRDRWLPLVAAGADRTRAETALAAVIDAMAADLVAALRAGCGADYPRCVEYAQRAGAAVREHDPGGAVAALADWDGARADAAICAGLGELLLTQRGEPRKRLTRNQGLTADNRSELGELSEILGELLRAQPALCARLQAARALPQSGYSAEQWQTIEAMYRLLQIAAAQLTLVFADAGRCDFTAVTAAALEALGPADAPTDLALALDYRLEHLLVDEFQDTSVTQHAMLRALTAGWTGDDGRTLFFVGDPLQSIYRFRQAEVGLFVDTAARGCFGEVALTRLRLNANFRSAAPLLDWVNDALARAFVEAPALLPPYVPLSPTRGTTPHAPLTVHPIDAGGDDAVLTDALVVLRVIEDIRARRPAASLAVLVRGREHLGLLPALLAAARIPVAATDIEPLSRVPIVNDLLLLTRALWQPADRVAWLGVLRAPWCGLSLVDLSRLVDGGRHALLWEALHDARWRATLDADARARVEALCAALGTALALVQRLGWAELVERTWRMLRGPIVGGDREALRHAERYFELLARFEAANRSPTASAFMGFLASHFAPVPRDVGNAVQIMTIHRAKGLEFDAVVIPGLERGVRGDRQVLALWVEHAAAREHGPLLAPVPAPGAQDEPINVFVRSLEKEEQRAEAYRLLYVGLTRAKDELHLCTRRRYDRGGALATPAASFLGMLRETLYHVVRDGAAAPTAAAAPLSPPPPRRLRTACLPSIAPALPAAEPLAVPEEWENATARHVGTVTHLLLELIGAEGLQAWTAEALAARHSFVTRELAVRGVRRAELASATARVVRAIATTLGSPRGRWIFDPRHRDAGSERRYGAVIDGATVEAVVDRVFIAHDADPAAGTRYIVDFKTGEPGTTALASFIDEEVARYRPQLERYAAVVRMTERRPIALALYFPSFDGWYEWRPEFP